MDAHQQWWQHYYGAAAPSAGYGPLTNAVRHHYQHPYHHPHTTNTTDHSAAPPAPTPAFPPEPLPPPPTPNHPAPSPLGVVPPNIPTLPDTWTPSDTHLDTNPVHGQTLFRTIQPTQWSRKYNLAGQPVLDVFPWQLSRFGLQDHSLRTLSQGRYTGIVTTRSIAEAVFTSQLLPEMRAHNLDIDNIAEYLHQQANQSIPNKTTDAKQFTQPLISRLIDFLYEASHHPQVKVQHSENFSNRPIAGTNKRANSSALATNWRLMASHLPQPNPEHTPPHHQLPNPISHLQPLQRSQPTPFLTLQLRPYTTTHQPTMRQQAFRNGSRHYHQPHRHKSPISSKFFETNISQKNSSRKQLHAMASRSAGYLSYHPAHYSSWWPRARHWRPDSLNKRCINQHISLYIF